ncbi:MAG: hypothetical protein EPO32_14915 [Anaerolineae bacterium]|nr:MAG: hypothetical protein EPO32_14915 [Anaerolineae bacterium]
MSASPYKRSSDFSTQDAAELRRELQGMDNAVEGAFRALSVPPLTSRRTTTEDTQAKFGEFIVADTRAGSIVITLPRIASAGRAQSTRAIGIARISASNTLTVRCDDGGTVNRAASLAFVPAAVGLVGIMIFDGVEYWI